MGDARITFPVIKGTNVRRNAETGVVIRKSEPDNGDGTYYTVEVSGRDSADVIMSWSAPTLAEARDSAVDAVVAVRAMRTSAHSAAISEHAERTLAAVREADHAEGLRDNHERDIAAQALAICASIPVDGRSAEVTELLEAAEMLTDEREHLAAVQHARKVYDGLAEARVDDRGLNLGIGHVAPATIAAAYDEALAEAGLAKALEQIEDWWARHGLIAPDTYALIGDRVLAARAADHAEALTMNAERRRDDDPNFAPLRVVRANFRRLDGRSMRLMGTGDMWLKPSGAPYRDAETGQIMVRTHLVRDPSMPLIIVPVDCLSLD